MAARFEQAANQSPADRSDRVGVGYVEDLYRKEAAELELYASRRLHGGQDARDVIHDIFFRILRFVRDGEMGPQEGRAFVRRSIRNEVIDRRRSECSRASNLEAWLPVSDVEPPDPHIQLETRDTLRRLEAAMTKLKPRTREIFLAHRIEGLSYAEIAVRYGITSKGVEKQMSKAIAQIDRMLDRR